MPDASTAVPSAIDEHKSFSAAKQAHIIGQNLLVSMGGF